MKDFLILKLQGAMQAWGGHTYDDFRPSYVFPTRSGVIGLLGACLGIDRNEISEQKDLNNSFELTIKVEKREIKKHTYSGIKNELLSIKKITDYHTVLDGRTASGKKRKDAILSHREYLCDAEFTLILDFKENAVYKVNDIKKAVDDPVFTPFLGRRSCPLHRPLFEKVIKAEKLKQVLNQLSKTEIKESNIVSEKQDKISASELIYTENKEIGDIPMQVRDVPIRSHIRQFANRTVFIGVKNNVS